jgi:phosphatidylinositol glycan class A protein
LQIVSTKVGGIPEVLPEDLIYLVEPNVTALIQGLEQAISDYHAGKVLCPTEVHKRICSFYNWHNVTKRTEIVYNSVKNEETRDIGKQLSSYIRSNVWPYLLVVSWCYIVLYFLEYFVPRKVCIFNHLHLANNLCTKNLKYV